jgi:RNA polymerase sigma-70 factor, ECF subfamily
VDHGATSGPSESAPFGASHRRDGRHGDCEAFGIMTTREAGGEPLAVGPIEERSPGGQSALVSRCVSGEAGAWRALHGKYHPVVAAYLRRLGVRDGELEDACQEVFLQTFRYLPSFRGAAELPTWLYRLCVTQARKARQRQRRRHAAEAREMLARDTDLGNGALGAEMSDRWAQKRVGAALEALTQGERLVFGLFEIRGLAGKEVAEIAGCPVATVWRRLHEARQTFRAAIEECRN